MYYVGKEIHFSYGHRLMDYEGKCAFLHGHNARVVIEVSSRMLNVQAMVVDFYQIRKVLGSWIDEALDHKMILCEKDPLAALLQKAGETVILIQENPTAEVLAKWIFDEARKRRLPVCRVTFWETENSFAAYHE